MNLPPHIRKQIDGTVLLAVKVQPRASRNEICAPAGNELKIRITAPPVDSAANQALVDFLAEILDCPRSALQIVRGQTSRHKQLAIKCLDEGVIESCGDHDRCAIVKP